MASATAGGRAMPEEPFDRPTGALRGAAGALDDDAYRLAHGLAGAPRPGGAGARWRAGAAPGRAGVGRARLVRRAVGAPGGARPPGLRVRRRGATRPVDDRAAGRLTGGR